ncbi:predicted protein [Sclerotinia sclerotiorum 1980 UF-70]|uniref:Uncharacterized protein n=2 Tax=Sclerotinia sclerotiorum (strain ATCC 18683 / 1980 / Ss-1) TaxID=665079 RepID=A7F508_SCLS1|nr:predicted protein [Sclerotinia sclerotiorum 1980 UF-70]APA06594.1 hypothetical protein sscle_02g013640 [Sclerotinia sclerotiorum 1980 UF-70]EDN97829.1 predicted protein [Sclerotinia sclerotiorum 1980 UF-70]
MDLRTYKLERVTGEEGKREDEDGGKGEAKDEKEEETIDVVLKEKRVSGR